MKQLNRSDRVVCSIGGDFRILFHSISSAKLDIQSAGPDRKRATIDDLKLGHKLSESD